MAIQFIDGFDHYQPSSEWQYKWDYFSGSNPSQVTGRFSFGQAVRFNTSNWLLKNVPSTQAWRIGCSIYLDSTSGSSVQMITLGDSGTSHVDVGFDSNRKIRVTRNGTQIGSVSTNAVPFQTWFHLEWYVVIEDSLSSGHCTVKINGTTELDLTSGDTRNGANASANTVQIGGQSFWNIYIDDFVISDMTVTSTPTFLGDRRIITLYPSGNGNYSQFVGSDGNSVNNSLLVDETGDINLTDYVESATAGNKDSYPVDDFTLTPGTIHAVQVVSCDAKSDAGTRQGNTFVRIGGTDYAGTAFYPASSPLIHRNLMENSPATSAAWTSSEVNGLEVGVKVEA